MSLRNSGLICFTSGQESLIQCYKDVSNRLRWRYKYILYYVSVCSARLFCLSVFWLVVGCDAQGRPLAFVAISFLYLTFDIEKATSSVIFGKNCLYCIVFMQVRNKSPACGCGGESVAGIQLSLHIRAVTEPPRSFTVLREHPN